MRDNGHKVERREVEAVLKEKLFPMLWSRLSREVVSSASLEVYKTSLYKVPSNQGRACFEQEVRPETS